LRIRVGINFDAVGTGKKATVLVGISVFLDHLVVFALDHGF